jgi:hypothetical protein
MKAHRCPGITAEPSFLVFLFVAGSVAVVGRRPCHRCASGTVAGVVVRVGPASATLVGVCARFALRGYA